MSFIKHIGKNGDRKVAVIFRQIPGDDHMCLVIYPDLLPTHMHDPLMKVLESPVGQQAEELADALHRNLFPDGRNMLSALHNERMMKRVRTDQVLMTPNQRSTVKLNELNKILNEMKTGADAVRRMAEIDGAAGLVDPKAKRAAEKAFKASQHQATEPVSKPSTGYLAAPIDGALDDKTIAANMLAQAKRMEAEAKSAIAEAARMKKEAEKMFPSVRPSKLVEAPVTTPAPVKTRGRKPKTAVEHVSQ
jgi:hypothetical protein